MQVSCCVLLAISTLVTPSFADNVNPTYDRLKVLYNYFAGPTDDRNITSRALLLKDVVQLAKTLSSLAHQGLQSKLPFFSDVPPQRSSRQNDSALPFPQRRKNVFGKPNPKISPAEIDERIAHFKGSNRLNVVSPRSSKTITRGEMTDLNEPEVFTKDASSTMSGISQPVPKQPPRSAADVKSWKAEDTREPRLQSGFYRNVQHFAEFPGEASSVSLKRGEEGHSRVERNAPDSQKRVISGFRLGFAVPPAGKTQSAWRPSAAVLPPVPRSTEWGDGENEVPQCIDCYQRAFEEVLNVPKFPTYNKLKHALTRVKATSSRIFRNLNEKIMACVHDGLSATLSDDRAVEESRQRDDGSRARNRIQDDLYLVTEDNRENNMGMTGARSADRRPYGRVSPAALLALAFANLPQRGRYRANRLTALANARSAATLARTSENFMRNSNRLLRSFPRASTLMFNEPLPLGVREKPLSFRKPFSLGVRENSLQFGDPLSLGVRDRGLHGGRPDRYRHSEPYAPALVDAKPASVPDSRYRLALPAPDEDKLTRRRGRFLQTPYISRDVSDLLGEVPAPPLTRPNLNAWSRNSQRFKTPTKTKSAKAAKTFGGNPLNTYLHKPSAAKDKFRSQLNLMGSYGDDDDHQKLASSGPEAKDTLTDDHLTQLDLQFLQWVREMKDKEQAFVRNTRRGSEVKNATRRKWAVLENKNSEDILRNLRAKVDRKTRPWGVFPILDVCAAKRKLRPLKQRDPAPSWSRRMKQQLSKQQQLSKLQLLNGRLQKLQHPFVRG